MPSPVQCLMAPFLLALLSPPTCYRYKPLEEPARTLPSAVPDSAMAGDSIWRFWNRPRQAVKELRLR